MMFVFTYNTLLFLKLPITDILSQYCWTLYMRQRYLKRKLLVFFFVSVSLPLECSCERWINLDKGVKPLGTVSRFCRDNRVQVFIIFFSLSFV